MDTIRSNNGTVVFPYRQDGQIVWEEGFVIRNYRNGQFIVSDHPKKSVNPRRFDICHILHIIHILQTGKQVS